MAENTQDKVHMTIKTPSISTTKCFDLHLVKVFRYNKDNFDPGLLFSGMVDFGFYMITKSLHNPKWFPFETPRNMVYFVSALLSFECPE